MFLYGNRNAGARVAPLRLLPRMADLSVWLVAHGTSWMELLGFISGALCVWLVTRQSIWNWPLGVITAGFYIAVFARAGLYSDTGLQVVYLALSFYGWWHWLRGSASRTRDGATYEARTSTKAAAALVVSRVPVREMLLLTGAGVAMWLLFYAISSRLPGTKSPLLDAALTATSLVAQYMMTRKYLENWMLWIAVDVAYIGLFLVRGLRLTSVLYAVYLVLAIIGYVQWKRSIARNLPASF